MKSYSSKLGFFAVTAFGLAIAATFTACGDSNTTEVTEQTGMDILAKGEKLPDCTKDNEGDMLYVTDSAAVYYCADSNWSTLNGKDGEPGKEGTSTEGKPGTSCTAETVKDGIEISCDGKVIGTVKNGEPGTATDGNPGVGCKIDESEGDGIVKVTCGEGKNAKTVILYKAMCGTESYEPEKSFCSEGKLYSCGGKPFDPAKQYCLTLKGENGEPVSKIEALLIDGRDEDNVQAYKTVTIGTQTWMAENLNYNTNTESETNSWCGGGSGTTEGDCSVYGRFYNWAAAIDSVALADDGYTCGYGNVCERLKATALVANPIQGVCPTGWHLPSDAEWETLFKVVDAKYTLESNTVGQKLKANSSLWETYSGVKNDDTFGFSVLPAGRRYNDGNFYGEGFSASFWSASEYRSHFAYRWYFYYNYDYVDRYNGDKNDGYSVRCLRSSH